MDSEILFKLFNISVIPAWILLAFASKHKITKQWVLNYRYPLLLALCYFFFIATGMLLNKSGGGMDSLNNLRLSFSNDYILLGAWIHYLVFDMLIGIWIVKSAKKHSIPSKLLPVFLFPTLFFGPIGFLIYRFYLHFKNLERI